jgi:hypothetical protein
MWRERQMKPDIVVGQPERKPSRQCHLEVVSRQTIPVVKEAVTELTLGQRTLRIWVFVADRCKCAIAANDVFRFLDTFSKKLCLLSGQVTLNMCI